MYHLSPNLTLGILNFESYAYLESLFFSVLNQTDKRFNVLIIDNGSRDGSWRLIQNFSNTFRSANPESEIKIIRNSQNSFSLQGTKSLLENCTTPYVSVVHSDDILADNFVETALEIIEKYPTVSAFNVELIEINEVGQTTGKNLKSNWSCNDFINKLLVCGLNPGVMPGSILNISFVKPFVTQEFPLQMNGNEDTLLWQTIIRNNGSIRQIPVATYFYRRHRGQTTNSSDAFAYSLGYSRRFNIEKAANKFQRLLALSEVKYEMNYVVNDNYLKGLGLDRSLQRYSLLRPLSIAIRRFASLINQLCSAQFVSRIKKKIQRF